MTKPRSTESRRKARAGLVAIRIGPRVYWVPSELARRIERIINGYLPPERAAIVRQWLSEAEDAMREEPMAPDRRPRRR